MRAAFPCRRCERVPIDFGRPLERDDSECQFAGQSSRCLGEPFATILCSIGTPEGWNVSGAKSQNKEPVAVRVMSWRMVKAPRELRRMYEDWVVTWQDECCPLASGNPVGGGTEVSVTQINTGQYSNAGL